VRDEFTGSVGGARCRCLKAASKSRAADQRHSIHTERHDFPTLIPFTIVTGRAFFSPVSIEQFAASAVKAYSVTPGAIERVLERVSGAKKNDRMSDQGFDTS
jgi:hypothetical protein